MADYADSRTSYDYDYFVGYKIEAALLDASLSAPRFHSRSTNGVDQAEGIAGILDALADARVRVDLLTTYWRVLSLQSLLPITLAFGRLERVALFIRDFCQRNLPSGGLVHCSL
jgi:hypothetical protein